MNTNKETMPTNRVPISVRIDQEVFDFITNLHINGANTPSEKIRELLTQARHSYERPHNYGSMLEYTETLLHDARHTILSCEKKMGVHSAILARVFEFLPDLLATLTTELPITNSTSDLIRYEREVMWRIVRMIDNILQLAIMSKGVGYDDTVLQELNNSLNLAQIVYHNRKGDSL